VGTVEMTVGELLGAKEHQVLRLDAAVDQPVDVLLEGQVVARGVLVAVDDRFGVRITELPRPLTP
jgi:flagellar motor switch protein FliN/FliY